MIIVLMTTTSSLEGFHVDKYLGVISKEIIFRSGLGKTLSAALSNLAASFTFHDFELTGSTKLIADAKEYVLKQFEQLAKSKGANAVIGVDVETSFGESLARVAISGTAVVVSPIDIISATDEAAVSITISTSNSLEGAAPVELIMTEQSGFSLAVLVLQSQNNAVPSDIMADLEFTSIFGDTQLVENICFIGIHATKAFRYESRPARVRLHEHIAPCIETCSIRIRKCRKDDQLIEINDTEMHAVEKLQETLNESNKQESFDEFGWIADETPGFTCCPQCGKRVSKDFMMYKKACISCGFPHEKAER